MLSFLFIDSIIANLNCPDCDVWVRARLIRITESSPFGENVRSYVSALGETTVTNQLEDNGPAVTDMVNWYAWNDDSTADQDYYKAIVTIGDEGTQDGYPVNQADWGAAYVANQAAIGADVMVFSLVGTVYPLPDYEADEANRNAVFEAMAIGGSGGGGHTFGATGGTFTLTTSNTIEADLEAIICTAGSGGQVPEPGTILLLGAGLLGLAGYRKKIFRKQ